jgi:CRISPR-associated protein (TIGR02710 family)
VSKVDPAKALLIAFTADSSSVLSSINCLTPDHLCFFLPEEQKHIIESDVQPNIVKMPRRWDWILTEDPENFTVSHQALAGQFPDLVKAWGVHPGELACDISDATPGMAAAMSFVCRPMVSRMVMVAKGKSSVSTGEISFPHQGSGPILTEGNPWNEEALQVRREACHMFNQGGFSQAAHLFHHIELMVSGGEKPMYHAWADMSEGYGLWERFHYRAAWDKLKTSHKSLELASVWGGPKGLAELLVLVKANMEFLEKLVLDPGEVKRVVAHDLLAHAKRRAHQDHHYELGTSILFRMLEAFSQYQLWTQFKIKTWDVQIDQLPETLKSRCKNCHLDDIDGKYKLPFLDQYRTLAELGDPIGKTFLAQWDGMKTLLDASYHSVLGHGFEPIKPERFHQLLELVYKLTQIPESSLPKFPHLSL